MLSNPQASKRLMLLGPVIAWLGRLGSHRAPCRARLSPITIDMAEFGKLFMKVV